MTYTETRHEIGNIALQGEPSQVVPIDGSFGEATSLIVEISASDVSNCGQGGVLWWWLVGAPRASPTGGAHSTTLAGTEPIWSAQKGTDSVRSAHPSLPGSASDSE